MILTQTCDLVRRTDGFKAPYITVSAVRPLASVINREMRKYKTNAVWCQADAVGERNKDRVKFFLQSLLNNNNLEYFYLHEQIPGGLPDRACVYLRLAISLRARHYNLLEKARILSLTPQFQAKLGWLVGNIYACVGTDDWVSTQMSESEWEELIETIMKEHVVMLNDRRVEYVKRHNEEAVVETWSIDEARQHVDKAPEFGRRDEVIEIVTKELVDAEILPAELATRARSHLKLSPLLKSKIGG